MSVLDDTLKDFFQTLSARTPTPGGGSVCAIVGATAASLCGMVGRLNDKKSGKPGPLHDSIEQADALRTQLEGLADQDIAAFQRLMAAWRLGEDVPDRDEQKQDATLAAAEAPLGIMASALQVMRLATVGLTTSKKNCISDAGVAALLAHASLESARLNVMINAPGIADEKKRQDLLNRCNAIRAEAASLAEVARAKIETLYPA